ncbi:hypothetical protein ACLK10_19590 [Escherichia coli]
MAVDWPGDFHLRQSSAFLLDLLAVTAPPSAQPLKHRQIAFVALPTVTDHVNEISWKICFAAADGNLTPRRSRWFDHRHHQNINTTRECQAKQR